MVGQGGGERHAGCCCAGQHDLLQLLQLLQETWRQSAADLGLWKGPTLLAYSTTSSPFL